MSEELENARRMAERGLKMAQSPPMESNYIDIFQHIIDKCGEARKEFKAISDDLEACAGDIV